VKLNFKVSYTLLTSLYRSSQVHGSPIHCYTLLTIGKCILQKGNTVSYKVCNTTTAHLLPQLCFIPYMSGASLKISQIHQRGQSLDVPTPLVKICRVVVTRPSTNLPS